MAILDDSTHSLDHLIELGATACRELLGMCFLKEPKLLKGHNCVAAGDLEIELGAILATQPSSGYGTYDLL